MSPRPSSQPSSGNALGPRLDRRQRIALAVLAAAGMAVAVLLVEPFSVRTGAMKCGGRKVTIMGTPGSDRIVGRRASDVIFGDAGHDRIVGGASGNDTICGGAGNDRLVGGVGNDRLYGGVGNDRLSGGRGSDKVLAGGAGRDRLVGGRGNDRASGSRGRDYLDGGLGDDRVDGGPGSRDRVIGGHGSDRARGGGGAADVVRGDLGRDRLDGGAGRRDVVSYASASGSVQVDLQHGVAKGDGRDRLRGFEAVIESPFSGSGSGGPSVVRGGGTLAIRGGDGSERIVVAVRGGRYVVSNASGLPAAAVSGCQPVGGWQALCARGVGLITIAAEGGNDTVRVRTVPRGVRVRVDGGWGADSLRGGRGDDVIEAGDDGDPDLLVGGAGDDALVGARTDQHVPADSGRSTMLGGGGDDVLIGGDPCDGDVYDGGAGDDNANFFRFTPGVSARIGGPARRRGGGCQPGRVRGSVEAMEGTPGRDRLIGNGRPNTISGGAGNDLLDGRGGRDRLVGGAGNDRLRYAAGRDAAHQ